MLEKPALADDQLVSIIRADFGIELASVEFLPIGADVDTAVYKGVANDGAEYFIKLRRGARADIGVRIPQALVENDVEHIIAPILTTSDGLWAQLDGYLVTLAPFISSDDGFGRDLADGQWFALGQALRGIHDAALPEAIYASLPREEFADDWRELVRAFLLQSNRPDFVDDAAEEMAQIMRAHQAVVSELLTHAQRLGDELRAEDLEFVPCHADIHAGNILIDHDERLYIVDWDTFMHAPKERDLMFIGGGIGDSWRGAHTERPFYAGYGSVEVDLRIIAYYRCERIIQDITEYGKQLLLSPEGGADRAQAVHYVASNFRPGSTIDIALASVAHANS